jgi:hypothetical protein
VANAHEPKPMHLVQSQGVATCGFEHDHPHVCCMGNPLCLELRRHFHRRCWPTVAMVFERSVSAQDHTCAHVMSCVCKLLIQPGLRHVRFNQA